MGRPSTFTQKIADELCARVVESDYGLEQVCEGDDMPTARCVFKWLASGSQPGFVQQYTRAKEAQGHVQADRATRDALAATDAALGRLKFDARKWQASKLAMKVYGDRTVLAGDPDAPLESRVDLSGLNPEQLRALANVKLPAHR